MFATYSQTCQGWTENGWKQTFAKDRSKAEKREFGNVRVRDSTTGKQQDKNLNNPKDTGNPNDKNSKYEH